MEFGAIVTDAGTRKIMEAVHEGKKVNIVDFAVGDGGGAPCTPDAGATKLINEIWRGSVVSCHTSEESENLLVIETVMPSDVGGFTIREMGIFDDEGILVAICNTPDTQKVKISDGVVHELNLIIEIAVSNIDRFELIVDPCVLMATKKDIENLNKKMDKLITGEEGGEGKPSFADGIEADNIVDAINKVFISGNEAKNKLVDNLVAMGVEASTDDTIGQLIDKILEMTNTSEDTVTAAVLLDGYTAHNAAGEQVTGIIPELAGVTVDATGTTQDSDYTYFEMPAGHYDEHSKVRSANSNLSFNGKIPSGMYLAVTGGTSFTLISRGVPADVVPHLRFVGGYVGGLSGRDETSTRDNYRHYGASVSYANGTVTSLPSDTYIACMGTKGGSGSGWTRFTSVCAVFEYI